MTSDSLLTVIGGIIILALIIIAVIIRLKNKPITEEDQKSAQEFLEGLSDTFYQNIVDIINNIDFQNYQSLPELEVDILNTIYDNTWNYVEEQLKDISKTDVLTALALKILNKEYVEKFIDGIIEKYDINNKISEAWNKYFSAKEKEVEEEDKKLQEQFSDDEKYITEESTPEDLPPVEKEEPSEEELKNIIPPSEEDPNYDASVDDSVEVLDETTTVEETDTPTEEINLT